jgi:hypothetical protein
MFNDGEETGQARWVYAQSDYCRCRILWRESNVDKPIMRRTDGPLKVECMSQNEGWVQDGCLGCLESSGRRIRIKERNKRIKRKKKMEDSTQG